MKYIYLSVFRPSDKKVLLQITNSASSTQMKEQCESDFLKVSKSFRIDAVYEGMREMNDDFNDAGYPAELEMELGGKPSWYSTCD